MALFKRVWQINPNFEDIDEVQRYIEDISNIIDQQKQKEVNYVEMMYNQAKQLFVQEQWNEALVMFRHVKSINPAYKSVDMYIEIAEDKVASLKAA